MIKENFYIFDNYLIKQKLHLSVCGLSYLVFRKGDKYLNFGVSVLNNPRCFEIYVSLLIGWVRLSFYK